MNLKDYGLLLLSFEMEMVFESEVFISLYNNIMSKFG